MPFRLFRSYTQKLITVVVMFNRDKIIGGG